MWEETIAAHTAELEKKHKAWKAIAMDNALQTAIAAVYMPKVTERIRLLGAAGQATTFLSTIQQRHTTPGGPSRSFLFHAAITVPQAAQHDTLTSHAHPHRLLHPLPALRVGGISALVTQSKALDFMRTILRYVEDRNRMHANYRYHPNELYDLIVRMLFNQRLHDGRMQQSV